MVKRKRKWLPCTRPACTRRGHHSHPASLFIDAAEQARLALAAADFKPAIQIGRKA